MSLDSSAGRPDSVSLPPAPARRSPRRALAALRRRPDPRPLPTPDRPRPATTAAPSGAPPIGALLRAAGAVDDVTLSDALAAQRRSGGRLGEVLVASSGVARDQITRALARQYGLALLDPGAEALPVLPAPVARALRAVVLEGDPRGGVTVAVADPAGAALPVLTQRFRRTRLDVRLGDDAALDRLLMSAYAEEDAADAVRVLRERVPELSAFRTALSPAQQRWSLALGLALCLGLLVSAQLTGVILASLAIAVFVLSTGARLYAAIKGWSADATINASEAQLAAMDERRLPVYTVLLPLYKEKPSTLATLFERAGRDWTTRSTSSTACC